MSFVHVPLTKEQMTALDAAARSEDTTRERLAMRLVTDGLASTRKTKGRTSTKRAATNNKAKEV